MRALIVGRFQPFHLGHLRMVEYVAFREDTVVIGIGSSNKSDTPDNPFTFEERAEMVRTSVPFGNYEISGIPDLGDDVKWVAWIKKNVKFDVAYTNSESERRIFKSAGIKVSPIPFFDREKYSAVKIRERIIKGKEWENLVPRSTLDVMTRINGADRIRRLNQA